jgi:hypothetical protein
MNLETRYVTFLIDRIDKHIGSLPPSDTQGELSLHIQELRGVVDAVFATPGTTKLSKPKRQRIGNKTSEITFNTEGD